MDSSIEDIEFLARSPHRVGVLGALVEGPCDRDNLRATTGASSPTMGRILADFEDRWWLARDGPVYRLTPLGEFVAERFLDLREAMETERKLRNVWRWLPREMEGFSVDLFADAVVSYPGPGYPYEPVERVLHLYEATSRIRGFGTVVVKSGSLETICGVVIGGTEMEFMFPPSVLETIIAWNPERMGETAACENCTVFVHDALPDGDRCGLSIVDDRVAICGHDADTGALRVIIDTDAPEAREWAISVFERYRQEATLVDEATADTLIPPELSA